MVNATAEIETIPGSWIWFIPVGGLVGICNLLIFGAVTRYRKLREQKEWNILAALALADAAAGLVIMCASMWRIPLILNQQSTGTMTQRQCLFMPHVVLYTFGDNMQAVMLTAVSIDRLISVSVPLNYFTWSTTYAHRFIGVFYTYGAFSGLAMLAVALMKENESVSIMCTPESALGNATMIYCFWVNVIMGCISVVLYTFVPVLYYARCTNLATNPIKEKQVETLKAMVVTLGMSASCTFVLYVCPNVARIFMGSGEGIWFELFEYAAVVQNCNALMNIIFYMTRHTDIRMAIISFALCRNKMPNRSKSINLMAWKRSGKVEPTANVQESSLDNE